MRTQKWRVDSAKSHPARAPTTWLCSRSIFVLNCSTCSPDLSPIENMRHSMKQKKSNKVDPEQLSSWNPLSGKNETTSHLVKSRELLREETYPYPNCLTHAAGFKSKLSTSFFDITQNSSVSTFDTLFLHYPLLNMWLKWFAHKQILFSLTLHTLARLFLVPKPLNCFLLILVCVSLIPYISMCT